MAVTSVDVPGNLSVRVAGLRRTVTDLRRSIDFYRGALGFEPSAVGTRSTAATRLRLGEQHIDLIVADEPGDVPAPVNAPDLRFQHAAVVTGDMEIAWRRLEAHAAVAISRDGPQRLPVDTGGVTAFKFRDPDGHPLELIQFPAGTGDPCWQAGGARNSTLGIDHFALVVESVEASAAFFAAFGFQVVGRGVNRGVEQDRLDGLEGVIVDVVSLAPTHGPRTPHLELLSYRLPSFARDGDGMTLMPETRGRDEILWVSGHDRLGHRASLRVQDAEGHRFIIVPSALS